MKITIKDKDNALVLREDGTLDLYVTKDDPVSGATQLVTAIAVLLSSDDEDFLKYVFKRWDEIMAKGEALEKKPPKRRKKK